jgi:hypothetical protein
VQLNHEWHSRLPSVGSASQGRVFYGAAYEGVVYAVAMWSNPVARMLPQGTWLELRRFAVADDAPKNTASRMLGWMTRDIRARFPELVRLISYQDCEVHHGTIYRAAGWTAGPRSDGGEWTRPSRWRSATQSSAPKIRWEKPLRP